MAEDHLDNEISISGQLTETGIKAGAKSRALSSIDRLLGNVVDLASAPLENIAKRQRARGDADVALIEKAGEMSLHNLHDNPEMAQAILGQHLKKIGRQHENKRAVVKMAIEDLRDTPPTEEQSSIGSDTLVPEFLDRFEFYAESATEADLRLRWGRILASEIREPGTFSGKVLRVIDEMESDVAGLFEKLCAARLGTVVPRFIAPALTFNQRAQIIDAGLIFDPGVGQIRKSSRADGTDKDFFHFGAHMIAVPSDAIFTEDYASQDIALVKDENGRPAVPIYMLTKSGQAIASIISTNEKLSTRKLAQGMAKVASGYVIVAYDIADAKAVPFAEFKL